MTHCIGCYARECKKLEDSDIPPCPFSTCGDEGAIMANNQKLFAKARETCSECALADPDDFAIRFKHDYRALL